MRREFTVEGEQAEPEQVARLVGSVRVDGDGDLRFEVRQDGSETRHTVAFISHRLGSLWLYGGLPQSFGLRLGVSGNIKVGGAA